MTIQAPQLDINTVAAGGGSRLYFRTGVFQVHQGPGSAMCRWCCQLAGTERTRLFAGGTAICWRPPRASVLQEARRPACPDRRKPGAGPHPPGTPAPDVQSLGV